ncbi:MAG: GspMb/PilO family protein [Planctomycetota bacterium]
MESQKKQWVILSAVSGLLAIGLSALIYLQHKSIDEQRATAAERREDIAKARKLIKATPDLMKEVIIQRETDATIREILSDKEDLNLNNLMGTLREFMVKSGCQISKLSPVPDRASGKKGKEDFARVRYTLQLEADIFQLLAFMSEVESHSRLMSVADFKLTAARRQAYEQGTEPRHRITLDIEAYVYASTAASKAVRIDNYERKRDLLVSEISRRSSELRVPAYDYRGPQGRRDPWVDPRVPVSGPDAPTLTIEEQIAIVDELLVEADQLSVLWTEVEAAENMITEIRKRSELEKAMVRLEEQIRKVKAGGQVSFVPAARRMERQVVAVVENLRDQLTASDGRGSGPTMTALREVRDAMRRLRDGGEYELALDTLADLEPRLPMAEREPAKKPLVDELYDMKRVLETVLAFEQFDLEIQGIAVYQDRRPVALINGTAIAEGELIGDELLVQRITIDRVEFNFRGVRVARELDEFMNRTARN